MKLAAWCMALLCALMDSTAAHAQVGYSLQVTANYRNNVSGYPDAAYVIFKNTGLSSFTGTVSVTGTSNVDPSLDINTSGTVTLRAGQSKKYILGDTSEDGGWNGANGLQVQYSGTVAVGTHSESVLLSAYDANIHSGVYHTMADGVTQSDAYLLEGGDPYADPGIENFPTPGKQVWTENGIFPEGKSTGLMVGGACPFGLALLFKRRRSVGWRVRDKLN